MFYPDYTGTATQKFLGAMLLESKYFAKYKTMPLGLIIEEHNQNIFKVMKELYEEFGGFNLETVMLRMKAEPMTTEALYLSNCYFLCTYSGFHETFASEMYNEAVRHYIHKITLRTSDALDEDKDSQEILDDMTGMIAKLKAWKQQQALPTITDNFSAFYEKLCSEFDAKDTPPLVTGFPSLDGALGRLLPGQLHVVAARPRIGKSMFALNVLNNIAKQGKHVLYFSLEMSQDQMVQRLLSINGGLPSEGFRINKMNDDFISKVSQSHDAISNLPITFSYKSGLTCEQVEQIIISEKENHPVDMVIIDHMHIMQARGDMQYQKMTAISNGLKIISMNQQVPIIALAQLNRSADGSEPTLSSLRDSGAIEQDAETVLFLHREEDPDCDPSALKLLLRKNRNGIGFLDILCQINFSNYQIREVRDVLSQTEMTSCRKPKSQTS